MHSYIISLSLNKFKIRDGYKRMNIVTVCYGGHWDHQYDDQWPDQITHVWQKFTSHANKQLQMQMNNTTGMFPENTWRWWEYHECARIQFMALCYTTSLSLSLLLFGLRQKNNLKRKKWWTCWDAFVIQCFWLQESQLDIEQQVPARSIMF